MKLMRFLGVLFVSILFTSCSTIFYGKSTKVTFASEYAGDTIDLFAVGPKDTVRIDSIVLPYTMKVKHNNLPLRVSVYSDSIEYDNFTIREVEKGSGWGYIGRFVGWITISSMTLVDGALLLGGAMSTDALIPSVVFGGVGGLLLAMGYTSETNVPVKDYYNLKARPYSDENIFMATDWYREVKEISDIYTLLNHKQYILSEAKARFMIAKRPTAELYYLKGVSNYYLENTKKSIEDLTNALNILEVEENAGLRKEVEELLDVVEKKRLADQQRKSQMWSQIALGTLQLASSAYQSYTQYNNWVEFGITPSGVVVDPSKLTPDMRNNLINPDFAMQQVNQQYWSRYMEFCRYNKKPDGSNYTYSEWCAIEGEMINNAKQQGFDIIAEQRAINEQMKEDFKEQRKADKAAWFERMGYDAPASTGVTSKSKTSSSSHNESVANKTVESSTPSYTSGNSYNNDNEKELDAKQQFKSDPVASSDYQDTHRKVSLYLRTSQTNRVKFSNKTLYKKGAFYYVEISGTFYQVYAGGNWGFNSYIMWAHDRLYLNI